MHVFLLILLGVDLIAVVAVLLTGAIGMAAESPNPRRQNILMRWRVGLQAIAIILVVALLLWGRW
ncbi:MAG TPA: twin transmembrane helix small protein [Acetobacteraceae bacterium]|nr:twin transmembrane helix small protein [Acetobacteraceae bacterium]